MLHPQASATLPKCVSSPRAMTRLENFYLANAAVGQFAPRRTSHLHLPLQVGFPNGPCQSPRDALIR
jgi:hypothetical protein